MREIKLIIDGKEVQLTDEQIKALGIETKRNPFDRVAVDDMYYFISHFGDVDGYRQASDYEDDALFNNSNYFNDEQFANQVALHQLLYRKLLKFAYDNEFEDTAKWDNIERHFCVIYDGIIKNYVIWEGNSNKHFTVYFSSEEGAKKAIKEVVEPFVKEHPEFKW